MIGKEEWGPWIEHDGGYAPYLAGVWVEGDTLVGILSGYTVVDTFIDREQWRVEDGQGESWNWANWPEFGKIIRYRIRKPRALMDLIELVENLPAPVGPKVDA